MRPPRADMCSPESKRHCCLCRKTSQGRATCLGSGPKPTHIYDTQNKHAGPHFAETRAQCSFQSFGPRMQASRSAANQQARANTEYRTCSKEVVHACAAPLPCLHTYYAFSPPIIAQNTHGNKEQKTMTKMGCGNSTRTERLAFFCFVFVVSSQSWSPPFAPPLVKTSSSRTKDQALLARTVCMYTVMHAATLQKKPLSSHQAARPSRLYEGYRL